MSITTIAIVAVGVLFAFFIIRNAFRKNTNKVKGVAKGAGDLTEVTELPDDQPEDTETAKETPGPSKPTKQGFFSIFKRKKIPTEAAEIPAATTALATTSETTPAPAAQSGDIQNADKPPVPDRPKKKYGPVLAYVLNDIARACGYSLLPGNVVTEIMNTYGTLGRPRLKDGKYIHYIKHTKDDKYMPYYFPYSPNDSSSTLYQDRLHPEVPTLWNMKREQGTLEKYGIYFIFAGIVIFLMWSAVAK